MYQDQRDPNYKCDNVVFNIPLSLHSTNRNSAAQCFTSVSIWVIRRTSLFRKALPTSGLFLTSRNGGSTCVDTQAHTFMTKMKISQYFTIKSSSNLTFIRKNFLVSLWMRELSVSRFNEGSRVSFSLFPWKYNTNRWRR